MATIVCQGLQSCLQEPQLVEPRTIRLKLSSPVPHHLFSATPLELGFKPFLSSADSKLSHEEKCHSEKPAVTKNSDLGGCWSFLQSISNNSSQQQHYPPTPVYKRSSSATRLNQKSLELCTENLGNETGTIFIENSIFDSNDKKFENRGGQQQKQSKSLGGKKSATVHNFPPPLTTISSGSESLQVRPHREDGRLILKAVKAPLAHTCFQAERSHGRLRLCFTQDFFADPDIDYYSKTSQTAANQEDIEANSGEDNENEGYENEGYENDREDEEQQQQEQEVGDGDKLFLGELENRVGCMIEDEYLEENSLKVGGEEGIMDKFERPTSRCKEGGEHEKKGLLNFEHLNWVAT